MRKNRLKKAMLWLLFLAGFAFVFMPFTLKQPQITWVLNMPHVFVFAFAASLFFVLVTLLYCLLFIDMES